MPNLYIRTIELRKTGRTFGIWINGHLVEGGFFSLSAAESAVAWWKANYRE